MRRKQADTYHVLVRDYKNSNLLSTRTIRITAEKLELARLKGIRLFNSYKYASSLAQSYNSELESDVNLGRFIKYKTVCEGAEFFIPYKTTVRRGHTDGSNKN